MRKNCFRIIVIRNQRGISAVMVAILTVVIVGFAALAIDIGHLVVVRNELQNAADAGALAGARVLYVYSEEGTEVDLRVNTYANQVSYDTAIANKSEKVPVDVHWTSGNEGDVQRGHWSFATRTFTPSDVTGPPPLCYTGTECYSTQELDGNLDFVNAVRVKVRRQDTPAVSYLARIFGYESFTVTAEAVAYLGFAGNLKPGELDQPIAICKQAIMQNNKYSCSTGRMINSGNQSSHNTAAWTNFSQPCQTASVPTVKPLVCGDGNPLEVVFGSGIGTTNGMEDVVHKKLIDCWYSAGLDSDGNRIPDQLWKLTLPVIDCGDDLRIGICMEVVGAVEISVAWITASGEGQVLAPRKMTRPDGSLWTCDPSWTDQQCWDSFISPENFNLRNWDGSPAPLTKKSIYFIPDCKPHVPEGTTGGENFGILAKIPKLVK